jgi:hypothetical protein
MWETSPDFASEIKGSQRFAEQFMGDCLVCTMFLFVGLVSFGIKEQFACFPIPSFGKFNAGERRQNLVFLQFIERIPLAVTQSLDQSMSPGVIVLIKVVLCLVDSLVELIGPDCSTDRFDRNAIRAGIMR